MWNPSSVAQNRLADKGAAFGNQGLADILERSAIRACWHGKLPFGACSRHTSPVVVGRHQRASVGLSRLIRRSMSANRSPGDGNLSHLEDCVAPIDVARQMGADVLIVVGFPEELKKGRN